MSNMNVIAVIGMGYSGSTILNFIFDSHSKIYGGGELHWLTKATEDMLPVDWQCTECGENCSYWTRERILSCTPENVYEIAASAFNVEVIVDTSKDVNWFVPKTNSQTSKLIPVLLVKHPLRHLASFVSLRTKDDYAQYTRWKKFKMRIRGQSLEDDIIETYLNYMDWYYQNGVPAELGGKSISIIRYEDVVLKTEETLSPVLQECGLEFEEEMLLPFSHDHHQIGGNTGPVYLKSGKWTGDMKLSHKDRLVHYEYIKRNNEKKKQDSMIFIDNKYENILNLKQINKLLRNKKYKSLCDRFNYEYDPRG